MLFFICISCDSTKSDKISTIYSLKADPTEANVEKIRSRLHDSDRDIRATALHALVTIGVQDSRELARNGLRDGDGFVRATAAKLMGDIGDTDLVDALAERLAADRDPVVRQRAAEALARIGGGSAVLGLAEGLADPDPAVRLAAIRGIRELDPAFDPATLSRLLLEDPSFEVRVQAARALGSTGNPEFLPVLERALLDENEFVRAAASNALRLQGQAHEESPSGGDTP